MNVHVRQSMGHLRIQARSRGFTLIEIMIAMGIAVLIFTLGFVILRGTRLASAETQTRIKATDSARVFFKMLERDLKGAYPGDWDSPPVSDAWKVTTRKEDLSYSKGGLVSGQVLQMTTHVDSLVAGAEIASVRYFVPMNSNILFKETSLLPSPPPADNYPFNILPSPAPTNDLALIQGVLELGVEYQRWNEKKIKIGAKNVWDRALMTWDGTQWLRYGNKEDDLGIYAATHLSVRLKFKDPNKKLNQTYIFWRTFPIPETFD